MGGLHPRLIFSFGRRNLLVHSTLGTASPGETRCGCADVSCARRRRPLTTRLVFSWAAQSSSVRGYARTNLVVISGAWFKVDKESAATWGTATVERVAR